MLLAASSTPWPVIVVWVVAVLFAKLAQHQKTPPPRRLLAPPGPADEARSEMGDTLQRAMEKLRQAEREAKQGQVAPSAARRAAQEQLTRSYQERQRRSAEAQARQPQPRRTLAQLEDHSALSQQSEPEVVDYDDAAAPASTAVRPSAPLSRYADGSLTGAIILGEILGRPVSER